MEIKTKDDGKKRAQSVEAELELYSDSTTWGNFSVRFEGFGADDWSAKQNLLGKVDELVSKLMEIKDEHS